MYQNNVIASFSDLVKPEAAPIEILDDNWTHGIIIYTRESC